MTVDFVSYAVALCLGIFRMVGMYESADDFLAEKWNFEGTYVVSSYIEKEMWKP